MSNTESGDTGEFVKRRFSLTHEADNLIDELANEKHGGNRSACVRKAVYAMHQRRDEDELRHGLKRLVNEVEAIGDQIDSLQQAELHSGGVTDRSPGRNASVSPTESAEALRHTTVSDSDTAIAREVYAFMMNESSTTFTASELQGHLEYSLKELSAGIDELIQKGAIELVNSDSVPQYQLMDS